MTVRSLVPWALAALLVAALMLGRVAPAHAARGMEVAISDEDAMVNGKGDTALAYNTAQALNATRMRILVEWSRVSDADDPTPSTHPDYDWGPIDRAIDTAAAHGMRTQLALAGPAPAYASGNGQVSIPVWSPDPARYADFARAAAAALPGPRRPLLDLERAQLPVLARAPEPVAAALSRALRGRLRRDQVGRPKRAGADRRDRALRRQGRHQDEGQETARRCRRGKRLGLATAPLKWLRAVACVNARYKRINGCTPLHADGYAHHPYDLEFGGDATPPNTKKFPGADNAPIETLGNLRQALDKLASAGALSTPSGKPLDIYLTESGYFISGKRSWPPAKRAKFLPQQFQLAAAQPRVREMLQYNVFAPTERVHDRACSRSTGRLFAEYKTLLAWTKQPAAKGLIKRNTGPVDLPPAPPSS